MFINNISNMAEISKRYQSKLESKGKFFKYPILAEDILRIPKLPRAEFRHNVVSNSYYPWRKANKHVKGFNTRDYERIWKYITEALIDELIHNPHGVALPFQLGELYIGTPANKEYFECLDYENVNHLIWRNTVKYCDADLRYYYLHSCLKNVKAAIFRNKYYITAKEKIPMHRRDLKKYKRNDN